MPCRCKNICETYKDVSHLSHSYPSGKISFCRTCQKMFLVKDTNNYRCFCCNGKTRRTARTKSMIKEEKHRYE